jgi:adenylosuccinate synthase
MKNIAVLDCLLGDNGKGHFTHHFSPKYDWVIRHAGSENCGHVIYRDGKKYTHHYLPSADYRCKTVKSYLASGMYINLENLLAEILLFEKDFPGVGESIYVDMDAFTISSGHIDLDKAHNTGVGSTGKGVGPAAVSKYSRNGSRVYNYMNDDAEVIKKLKAVGVTFTTVLAMKEEFEKSRLLFEGSQGVMLDINAGLYPYVTAGDCTVSGIAASGFNFVKLDRVYGMMKPYVTKAGSPGPLPTEMSSEDAIQWRELGGEIGATTGKPRRIGYLDLPMLKYGIQKGGITHLIVCKMDIPEGQRSIKTCVSYGKEVFSPSDFNNVNPTYLDLPCWKDSKDANQTRSFLKYVESFTKTPIEYISTGVKPEDVISLAPKEPNTRLMDPFEFLTN